MGTIIDERCPHCSVHGKLEKLQILRFIRPVREDKPETQTRSEEGGTASEDKGCTEYRINWQQRAKRTHSAKPYEIWCMGATNELQV